MPDKSFYELNSQLQELTIALENEISQKIRSDIENNINRIRKQISEYDLSDDDLFECNNCQGVFDIKESVRTEKGNYICEQCSSNIKGH